MAYQIDCIQKWENFTHENTEFCLKHLDAHELRFQSEKKGLLKFVVTYGLHVFTKEGTPHSIPHILYSDARDERPVDIERYHASKYLKGILSRIDTKGVLIYETTKAKYFTLDVQNNMSGTPEPYKICLSAFKENRILRLHVISAYFAREGEGSPDQPVEKKGFSFFKLAHDVHALPRSSRGPKEVYNRK
tara:strand:+ start:2703 stop:3272 length:570 start_codon:yes stop_codon:yes gene_type:complete